MGTGFPFGVIIMFWNKIVMSFAQHCECTKFPWIVYFKMDTMVIFCYLCFTTIQKEVPLPPGSHSPCQGQ